MHFVNSAPLDSPTIVTVAPVDYTDLSRFPAAEVLAEDICACHDEGAAVVHFHVTDAEGQATADPSFFDSVVRRVREHCDIIIQASTGGVGVPWETRIAALSAEAVEMVSLNMGTCNLFGQAYVNTPEDIVELGLQIAAQKVIPEMCFFEPGFFATLADLRGNSGTVGSPVASICLGFPGALPASIENLVFMKSKMPREANWSLVHHGAQDFGLLAAAVAAGGNIRVGFEDSDSLGAGRRAKTNAELVRKASSLVKQLDRRLASVAETRAAYGLTQRPHSSAVTTLSE